MTRAQRLGLRGAALWLAALAALGAQAQQDPAVRDPATQAPAPQDSALQDPGARVEAILAAAERAASADGDGAALAKALEDLLQLREASVLAEAALRDRCATGPAPVRAAYLRALADIACWLPGAPEYRADLEASLGAPPEGARPQLLWHLQRARLRARLGAAERSLDDLQHRLSFGDAFDADMVLDVLPSHGDAARQILSALRIRLLGADPGLYGTGEVLHLRLRSGQLLGELSDSPQDQQLVARMQRWSQPSTARPARSALPGNAALRAAVLALAGPDAEDARLRLEEAGPAAVPELAATLAAYHGGTAPGVDVRAEVCSLLEGMGPTGGPAAPELWDTLRTAPARLLPDVLAALGDVGPWSPNPLPLLVVTVDREEGEGTVTINGERLHSALDLALVGRIESTAAAAMTRLQRDPNRTPLELAADLSSPDAETRDFAADALRALGPRAHLAAPALQEALRSAGPHPALEPGDTTDPRGAGSIAERKAAFLWHASRHHIAQALTAVRASHPDAAPAWAHLLEHGNTAFDRLEGAQGLGRCGAAARPFVPLMVEQFETADARVLRAIVTALGTLGPIAAEAAPALEALAADPAQEPALRALAEHAATRITGGS